MEIDKDQIVKLLRSKGDAAKADQARSELPDKVDPERDSGLLSGSASTPRSFWVTLAAGSGRCSVDRRRDVSFGVAWGCRGHRWCADSSSVGGRGPPGASPGGRSTANGCRRLVQVHARQAEARTSQVAVTPDARCRSADSRATSRRLPARMRRIATDEMPTRQPAPHGRSARRQLTAPEVPRTASRSRRAYPVSGRASTAWTANDPTDAETSEDSGGRPDTTLLMVGEIREQVVDLPLPTRQSLVEMAPLASRRPGAPARDACVSLRRRGRPAPALTRRRRQPPEPGPGPLPWCRSGRRGSAPWVHPGAGRW